MSRNKKFIRNALKFAIGIFGTIFFAFHFIQFYFKFTKLHIERMIIFWRKISILCTYICRCTIFLVFNCNPLSLSIHRYSHLSYQWKIVTEQCIFSRIYQTTFTKTNSGTKWVNNCQSNSKGRNRRRRWWFGWRFVLKRINTLGTTV